VRSGFPFQYEPPIWCVILFISPMVNSQTL
jgi:hypothetical protein